MATSISVHFASFLAVLRAAPTTKRQQHTTAKCDRKSGSQGEQSMIRNAFFTLLGLTVTSTANAEWALNMPKGVTELSLETYDLHMMVFWWCVAIAVVVFGVMVYSLLVHRKSKGAVSAKFSHSTTAEVVWTLVPVVILIVMAIPTAETMVRLEDTRDPDISIVITGFQWKWHYKYQDEGIAYYSSLARSSLAARQKQSDVDPFSVENYLLDVDNPVVVPRDAKVRLLLTAKDVIHSWWVPDLAIKKDAIPGMVNETWFRATELGTYRGQCAELCGKDHGYMPVVVEVVEPEAYRAWVASHDAEQ
jgi:cytochrome c oxidase subunit 2